MTKLAEIVENQFRKLIEHRGHNIEQFSFDHDYTLKQIVVNKNKVKLFVIKYKNFSQEDIHGKKSKKRVERI